MKTVSRRTRTQSLGAFLFALGLFAFTSCVVNPCT